MSITFDRASNTFQLNTKTTSYLIGIADGRYIGHIYYGKKLDNCQGSYAFLRTEERPFVPSRNQRDKGGFGDAFPYEYSTSGVGDYRENCLSVRTTQGHRVCELIYTGHQILDGKPELPGLPATFAKDGDQTQTLEITCEDPQIGLKAILRYSVFADADAVIRSVLLENTGSEPLYIERALSACMDLDDESFEMLTLTGSWARERHMTRCPVTYGKHAASSVRGCSSHQEHPFAALVTPGTTQDSGEVYAMHFVYSGNFLTLCQKSQYDSVRMVMGIHPEGFEWVLKPGNTFQTPEVVCVYSDQGLGKMSRTLHDLYRGHLIRSPYLHKKRPVLINNWEATYFDFDSDKLMEIARDAKEAGIEMLVMDDGWFGHRNLDDSSLGDWTVNEEKLPGGLPALVERVKAEGLSFGIWFEPEMVSPDSDLYRAHPDWAIQIPGRTPTQSRAQYVLDLSRPEVVDHVYECVAKILRSADISYVKWDMNRQFTDLGSAALPPEQQGELAHRYILGVYELQECLVTEFPELLLENCASGGGRFDPGMLYYSPQIWCSDDTDAVERLAIQEGTALLYPLSCMGAHVSACPNHIVGRNTPFETRGHVALDGTFGYELDITKLPAEEKEKVKQQIALYHRYDHLVREGAYYRIASWQENHRYDCWEVAAKDQSEALATYVQVLAGANVRSRRIRLKGLDEGALYRLEGTEKVYSGQVLMYGGVLMEVREGDYVSRVMHFVRV
ncbi:alpha-galactosidase [Lachnospiraceae bacterium]|nr:alpha-galactosidase [Lachnospiraceae bacterium]